MLGLSENEIMLNWNLDSSNITVSVQCLTYNHERYIEQCLDGILMQKCNFHFEVILHDDASNDNTILILKEYIEKYPRIIKAILQTENKYKTNPLLPGLISLKACSGKYVAICEGDDYWTDPYKLQKQVDFLDSNPEFSSCFHAVKCENAINANVFYIKRPFNINHSCEISIKQIIKGGGGLIPTNSLLLHNKLVFDFEEWAENSPVGDLPLVLVLAYRGKMGYIDEVMAVYRYLSIGSWTSNFFNSFQKRQKVLFSLLKFWDFFNTKTLRKFSTTIFSVKISLYVSILKLYISHFLKMPYKYWLTNEKN